MSQAMDPTQDRIHPSITSVLDVAMACDMSSCPIMLEFIYKNTGRFDPPMELFGKAGPDNESFIHRLQVLHVMFGEPQVIIYY